MKIPVISNLKQPKYLLIFLGSAILFFDVSYYLMSKLPGSRDFMCVEGASLTPGNIGFSALLSVLTGLMIVGFIALFRVQALQKNAALSSMGGIGLGIGSFTMFCPLCSLPILSVFGLSVFFELFVEYDLLFKGISLVLLLVSLYMLNKQLSDDCERCIIRA